MPGLQYTLLSPRTAVERPGQSTSICKSCPQACRGISTPCSVPAPRLSARGRVPPSVSPVRRRAGAKEGEEQVRLSLRRHQRSSPKRSARTKKVPRRFSLACRSHIPQVPQNLQKALRGNPRPPWRQAPPELPQGPGLGGQSSAPGPGHEGKAGPLKITVPTSCRFAASKRRVSFQVQPSLPRAPNQFNGHVRFSPTEKALLCPPQSLLTSPPARAFPEGPCQGT